MTKYLFVSLVVLCGALATGCGGEPGTALLVGDDSGMAMMDGGLPMADAAMPLADSATPTQDAATPTQDAATACECTTVNSCCDGCHTINTGNACDDGDPWTSSSVCTLQGICAANGPRNTCIRDQYDTENVCCLPDAQGVLQPSNLGTVCNSGYFTTSHCGAQGQCFLLPTGDCSDGYHYTAAGTVINTTYSWACVTINGQLHAQLSTTTWACTGYSTSSASTTAVTLDHICVNFCNPNGPNGSAVCDQ